MTGTVGWAVDGSAGDADFLTVVGLDAGTVFALSSVDGAGVVTVSPVDVDKSLGVGSVRVRSGRRKKCQPKGLFQDDRVFVIIIHRPLAHQGEARWQTPKLLWGLLGGWKREGGAPSQAEVVPWSRAALVAGRGPSLLWK